jgi:multidrug efflux pump subunit AcrB
VDLFPESAPPQVVVITIQPGASADDVTDKITEPLEKEINTLSGLENLRSTSRDGVSSIMAEFVYAKPLGEALLDVQNAIARVRGDLPAGVREPRIYRLTEASSRPLLTLALRPKADSKKTWADVRLLAENQITDRILGLEGIADVDVFGGHRPEVQVRADRDRLVAHGVGIEEVVGVLARQNVSAPAGTVYAGESEYLVRTAGEFADLDAIRDLPIRRPGEGLLRIADVATVHLAEQDPRSLYHGNGRRAIALGIMRPDGGPTVAAIERFKRFLPRLEAEYPDIAFEITQDQQPLIDLNLSGMRLSIVQAIALTVAVIFLFLADLRAALVVSVSIPLAFLFTLAVLWLTPLTLNMVTLTGLIVAIGLVVDSSVVALENIYRHYDGMERPDAEQAAREGTHQIALAITAGMLTTVAVLVPIVFIGGRPQYTIGRVALTISTTLVASLVVALTVVPLVASRLLAKGHRRRNLLERAAAVVDRGVGVLRDVYLYVLHKALRWRVVTLLVAAAFLVLSVRIVLPLIGGELMPPMDTGIVIVEFTAPATDAPERVERILDDVEAVIYKEEGVEMVSSVVGSEPGALSFGTGGATAQSAKITVHLVDRTQRDETIWEIMDRWRRRLRTVPGIQARRVSEFGATPAATTKAPMDLLITGPDVRVLDRLADRVLATLKGMPGLTDVRRSWYVDEYETSVRVDPALARVYGTSPEQVARQLKAAVDGVPATPMRLAEYLDIPVRVAYRRPDIGSLPQVRDAYVGTAFGPVPLRTLADFEGRREQPFITRERLRASIDVTGVNTVYTIKQVHAKVRKRIRQIELPRGYDIAFSGTMADKKETQQRLMRCLLIGAVVLYLLLVAMFRSLADPLVIMSAIPLAVAGGLWGLLIFNKPMTNPGNMGMIFLAGTVINNSVLLLDFIKNARREGLKKREAILQSVRLRIRPILMTTFSTVVGLSPLVFEMAVGLERMSPLAIVAATGLLVGTFMTLVVTPVVYSSVDSLAFGFGRAWRYVSR